MARHVARDVAPRKQLFRGAPEAWQALLRAGRSALLVLSFRKACPAEGSGWAFFPR